MAGQRAESGIDFRQMMKTPAGRWFFAPAFMAVLAIAAWGLLLTVLQLQNGLPQWVYSAPAVPTIAIYYGIELRKTWIVHIRPELVNQQQTIGVAKQSVKDRAIAPNIQGDNNIIHQTIIQNPTPFRNAKTPSQPERPPAVPVVLSQKASVGDETGLPVVSTLYDREVNVAPGTYETSEMQLLKGDLVRGTLWSDAPLTAFILGERGFQEYYKSRQVGATRLLCDDDVAAQFQWTAPRAGRFFFVLDTYGKQASRRVKLRLERTGAPIRNLVE